MISSRGHASYVFRRCCGVALLIALALPARRSVADEAEARRLYADGEAAFTAGRFDEAAQLFQRGYVAFPRPLFLWNAAMAFRKQYAITHDPAELRRALTVYQHYVELVDAEAQRAEGRAAIAEVEAELARVATPPPAALTVATPPAAPSKSPERRHRVWPWLVGGAGLLVAGAVVLTVALVLPDNAPVRASTDGTMRVVFP
jgi:hypothetical protein